jgi:maleate cis-trans isomerase
VLLLTPFDARLNELIVAHLAKVGVTAIAPNSFDELAVPKRMTTDEVFDLTKKYLTAVAVLDPIPCQERIESELNATVVASNRAMFWYVLSKLGMKYPMTGYGRLLREWPALRD